jgi:ATP-dependent DNA helicase RecG
MLSMAFPGQVGILHGRMSSEEKEATMELFSQIDSSMSILVSTTVIEVSYFVDVYRLEDER